MMLTISKSKDEAIGNTYFMQWLKRQNLYTHLTHLLLNIFYFSTEDVLFTLTNVMESFTEIHFYLVFVL